MAVTLAPWPPDTSVAALAAARTCLRTELGRSGADLTDAQLDRLGGAAAAEVEVFAASAPQVLRDEAVIRYGRLARPGARGAHRQDGQGAGRVRGHVEIRTRGMSTASPLRASGASAIFWHGTAPWAPGRSPDEVAVAQARRRARLQGGAYAGTIFQAIEAAASTKVADASSATAAVEAAAGALSRAFMAAARSTGRHGCRRPSTPRMAGAGGPKPDPRGREPLSS